MPRGAGNKDQVLQTGRLAYGDDGTNFRVIRTDSSGNIILGAGTANIGDIDVLATKTIQTELFVCATVAASTQATSTVLDVSTIKKATVFISHGRSNTVAFGTQGTEYRIEGSERAAGNDTWHVLASLVCASTACLAVAASADVAAAGTTVVVTSGTSIPTRGDLVFWANTVAASSSEWMRTLAVTGTASFTIEEGLTVGQDSDTNIFTQAQREVFLLDVEGLTRVRVKINNNASGTTQQVYSRIACITEK